MSRSVVSRAAWKFYKKAGHCAAGVGRIFHVWHDDLNWTVFGSRPHGPRCCRAYHEQVRHLFLITSFVEGSLQVKCKPGFEHIKLSGALKYCSLPSDRDECLLPRSWSRVSMRIIEIMG